MRQKKLPFLGYMYGFQIIKLVNSNSLITSCSVALNSLPTELFGKSHVNIVDGSTIMIFCQALSTSPNLTLTWWKSNTRLTQDVPHILIRYIDFSPNSISSHLIVQPFRRDDTGNYRCTAEENGRLRRRGRTVRLQYFAGTCTYLSNNGGFFGMTG